ncbi:MAG: M23 family metallopeptidase [Gemmatimonadales bacterium]
MRVWGRFAISLGILLAAGIFALRGAWPWPGAHRTTFSLPELFRETVDTLRRGETLSDLFVRQGLPGFALSQIGVTQGFNPRRLRPGLVFTFRRRLSDSIPTRVMFRSAPQERTALHLLGDGWYPVPEPIRWRAEPMVLEGTITSSLYDALNLATADTILAPEDRVRLAWDLADVFAWQVDFSRDVRSGDRFQVLAERLISDDGEVRYGRVLASQLVIGGAPYSAYRFKLADGSAGFFDANGRSLRRTFLLAPVQFRRISSLPSSGRFHPILGIVRKHEGTDYAADPGTPVMAAGDGVVVRREWTGGFGNFIELRHANGIVTRYGHLQDYAAKLSIGQHIHQGEVIGYVGSTGLATGPHLHYEFRINGVARPPSSADLGSGEQVPLAQDRDFDRERARLAMMLSHPAGAGRSIASGTLPRSTTN